MNETSIPSSDLKISPELKKREDEVRDNITIMEGEGKRLFRINRELSKDIDDAINRRSVAENESVKAKLALDKLIADGITIKNDNAISLGYLEQANADLENAKKKLEETKANQSVIDNANAEKLSLIKSKVDALDKREEQINKKELELSKIKSDLQILLAKF